MHSLLVFMTAGVALNLTPGPDMLYVATRSAGEGRSAGVASALGIGAGTLVHIALVAGGLAALLAAVPIAYTIVRVAGAAYLIYLGVKALASQRLPRAPVLAPASKWAVFRQGVITNVLNPKVALFFLAFLPQFVDATRGNAVAQVIVLGLLFDTTGTIVNLVVALVSSRAANRFRMPGRRALVMQRLTGAIFIALGLRIAAGART